MDPIADIVSEAIDNALASQRLPATVRVALLSYKDVSAVLDLRYTIEGFFEALNQDRNEAYVNEIALGDLQTAVAIMREEVTKSSLSYVIHNGPYSEEQYRELTAEMNKEIARQFDPVELLISGYIKGYGFRIVLGDIADFLSAAADSIGSFFGALDKISDSLFEAIFGSERCFLAGTPIMLADGAEKPIERIVPGDRVMSVNAGGNLVPGRVSRVFQKDATHILDFFGLMVTPGHVMLCGDGRYAGRYVTLLDILRSDGAVVDVEGRRIRAATGAEVGSELDLEIEAVAGRPTPEGLVVAEAGRLRMGTRVILPTGADVALADLVAANDGRRTDEGLIASASGDGPFLWPFGLRLPRPEDYVLARSALTLADIYAAGEWETVPAMGLSTLEDQPLSGTRRREAPTPNLPLSMRAPSWEPLQ